MTKVIKGEFEKMMDIKVEDVSLTCDTSLEIFNMEVSRLSGMDNDLFTYKVEVANIPCNSVMDDDLEDETDDNMGYDPSDVAFIEWLRSRNFNYKTMDQYTMKALWIYWIRGDDEVELTDEESFDDEDEIAEIWTYFKGIIMGFKTYDDYKNDWIYEWNKDVPWVDEKPWTDTGDYEWYEALDDCELKEEALRNKAIMDGVINDDEYVAVKEDEYDDLIMTRRDACQAYQEIFPIMDEGWMVTRATLKWFTYVHDVILEVNDYLILCAYEFGVKYSICSRVVIMEMKDVLHALLRQFLVFKKYKPTKEEEEISKLKEICENVIYDISDSDSDLESTARSGPKDSEMEDTRGSGIRINA
ncbi:hypothetical protein Tco_0037664 [Tanacetum coccineum]